MRDMQLFNAKAIFAAVVALYALPQSALAENKAEIMETGTIEVVSTTPLPGIGTPVDQVPANVQAVSSKSLQQQHSLDISEYLDTNLSSVSTNNTVSNPYQADVTYRGFTASPLLGTPQGISVFLDGVRVNEPFGDVVNWDLVPANAIAGINLIPGSNPVFGLNTLGGALSLHTKSGAGFPGFSATASGGSWGRRAFQMEAGGQSGAVDYFVAGNTFREDGWRNHSNSAVDQLFTKVGWQDDKSDLDLSIMLADTDLHGTQALPLSMFNNRKQAYSWPDSIGNQLAMINLKGSHFITDDKLVAANIYYRKNQISGSNSNVETATTGEIINSTTDQDGFGAAVQLTLLGDMGKHKNQFTVGASADFGRVKFSSDIQDAIVVGDHQTVADPSDPDFSPTVRLKTRNDYYGVFATDTFSLTEQLHLTLSGRYNVAKIKLAGDNLQEDTSLDGDHVYNRFNPAIGFNYNPSKAMGFYGAYNEGMRAATPVELSCADPDHPCALPNAFLSDPPLKAVVSKTWEGGMRGQLSDTLRWNAALYQTENDNDIIFISTVPATNGYFSNVGKTRRQGLELGLSGKVDRLSFAGNYGFVDATFQTPFVASSLANSARDGSGNIQVNKGNKIPGIPRQTLKLRVAYDITQALNIGSNVVINSSQYARGDENNLDSNGKVPGYTVVHVDVNYSVNENWRLFAKVNNLFDRNYSTFGLLGENVFAGGAAEQFRTPAAPRAAWVGVTYDFGRSRKTGAQPDRD